MNIEIRWLESWWVRVCVRAHENIYVLQMAPQKEASNKMLEKII